MSSITVTYGRKIPGPQDYSSESLHITLVQDLGEQSEEGEIHSIIDALFETIKQEVDQKLRSTNGRPQLPNQNRFRNGPSTNRFANRNSDNGNRKASNKQVSYTRNRKASTKQVSYLLSLANQRGVGFEDLGALLQDETGKRDPYDLTSGEASRVIDSLKA